MLARVTPQSLLQQQVSSLLGHTDAVMDGAVEGVHAARIATRRIRELLPLTAEWHRPGVVERLHHRFRAVGRALGRVRDADIRIQLLTLLEPRIPSVAPLVVGVRQQQQRRRLELMRELIKRLEQEGVHDLMHEAMAERRVARAGEEAPDVAGGNGCSLSSANGRSAPQTRFATPRAYISPIESTRRVSRSRSCATRSRSPKRPEPSNDPGDSRLERGPGYSRRPARSSGAHRRACRCRAAGRGTRNR